jgi:ABC-2 type transport system permease protein
MSNTRRLIRQTLTIARRDFIATVFTPTFLIFLFAPLLMGTIGAISGMGAASVAQSSDEKTRIVAIVPGAQAALITQVDKRLRRVFRGADEAPPIFLVEAPAGPALAQARSLFNTREYDLAAVLYGPLDRPQILYGPKGERTADYLAELAENTLRVEKSGGTAPLSTAIKTSIAKARASKGDRSQAASLTAFAIFFLTLLLAGQTVASMAEERGNKVIEVLAAAVPLESVFLGKLLGLFGVAILFIAFWGTLVSQIGVLLPAGGAAAIAALTPAIGLPLFILLFFAYFTMSFMLYGAVFLGVGSQAATVREIQMLSLPITIVQVLMLGSVSVAIAHPNSWIATFAEIFPLSSPQAMAARAAQSADLWPHLVALSWQLLWVVAFITIGARAFRRGVLQSGSGKINWRGLLGGRIQRRNPTTRRARFQNDIDMNVS